MDCDQFDRLVVGEYIVVMKYMSVRSAIMVACIQMKETRVSNWCQTNYDVQKIVFIYVNVQVLYIGFTYAV